MKVSDTPSNRASKLLGVMNLSEKVVLLHGSHSEDKVSVQGFLFFAQISQLAAVQDVP